MTGAKVAYSLPGHIRQLSTASSIIKLLQAREGYYLSLSALTVHIPSIQGWMILPQCMKLKDDELNSQIYKYEQGPLETIQSSSHLVD